jgi:hypothetical protein
LKRRKEKGHLSQVLSLCVSSPFNGSHFAQELDTLKSSRINYLFPSKYHVSVFYFHSLASKEEQKREQNAELAKLKSQTTLTQLCYVKKL